MKIRTIMTVVMVCAGLSMIGGPVANAEPLRHFSLPGCEKRTYTEVVTSSEWYEARYDHDDPGRRFYRVWHVYSHSRPSYPLPNDERGWASCPL